MISMKFFTCRVYVESTGDVMQNNVFPPLLAAILNFYVERKNTFISETERDRAISTKLLTHRVSTESTGDFPQKSFSRHFWRSS